MTLPERSAVAKKREWRQIGRGILYLFSVQNACVGICRHSLLCGWKGGVSVWVVCGNTTFPTRLSDCLGFSASFLSNSDDLYDRLFAIFFYYMSNRMASIGEIRFEI